MRRLAAFLTLALAALGLAACGLVLSATGTTRISIGSSLLGLGLGGLLMLPGYWLRATGAGDVKLLAGAGAVLGAGGVVTAFLLTAIAGGILAIVFAAHRRRLQSTMVRVARFEVSGRSVLDHATAAMPYAPAIAVGTLLAALGLWR